MSTRESLVNKSFPARLCFRFLMMLEVSCARELLLEAEDYGHMSLVDFFRFFTDLFDFMRLHLHNFRGYLDFLTSAGIYGSNQAGG